MNQGYQGCTSHDNTNMNWSELSLQLTPEWAQDLRAPDLTQNQIHFYNADMLLARSRPTRRYSIQDFRVSQKKQITDFMWLFMDILSITT